MSRTKARRRPARISALEAKFDLAWRLFAPYGAPKPVFELRFLPPRRWRFDRAWPEHQVAVELEGGIYSGGRHVRGSGFVKDVEKYNAAASSGWLVLRFTGPELKANPEKIVRTVIEALKLRGYAGA